MKLSQFKFKLPEEKIALYPAKYRDESRLMVVHKSTGEIEHVIFKDILNYFDDKDAFIFNDTKVFPARLYGNKVHKCYFINSSVLTLIFPKVFCSSRTRQSSRYAFSLYS